MKATRRCILTLIMGLMLSTGLAQDDHTGEFDFWIGQWKIDQKIMDEDGEWLHFTAATKITPILEGQALEEHWEGEVQFFWLGMDEPRAITGHSIRYFDKEEGQWLIYWMDSLSPKIQKPFKGGFLRPGYGEFFRAPSSDGESRTRITFEQQNADSVRWSLAVSGENGNWTTIWMMDMKRQQ